MGSQKLTFVTDTNVVTLNVGGEIYATCWATLLRFPNSKLGNMFSPDRSFLVAADGKGRAFIDRDGKPFRHVLNFLRSDVLPASPLERKELMHEADYFEITPLIEALRKAKEMEEEEPDLSYIPLASDTRHLRKRIESHELYGQLKEIFVKEVIASRAAGHVGVTIDLSLMMSRPELVECVALLQSDWEKRGYATTFGNTGMLVIGTRTIGRSIRDVIVNLDNKSLGRIVRDKDCKVYS